MIRQNRSVALIGGGASCVATFVALVKRRIAETIYVIAPNVTRNGMAFRDAHPDLIANVSAGTMSAMVDDSSDFLNYLYKTGRSVDPDAFVPRSWVGEYLGDRFREYLDVAREQGIDIVHLPFQFESTRVVDTGGHVLVLRSGSTPYSIVATDVIFCTDTGAPQIPDVLKAYQGNPLLIDNPFPEARMLKRIPENSRVLVVGNGLLAVDAAILLGRKNCKMSMLSPSGILPAVCSRLVRDLPFRLDQDWLERILRGSVLDHGASLPKDLKYAYVRYLGYHLSGLVGSSWRNHLVKSSATGHWFREQVRFAELGQNQWQELIVDLVETINSIYANAGPSFAGAIHPTIRRGLAPYLNPLPLPSAKKILDLLNKGLLNIEKGELKNVISPASTNTPWQIDCDGQRRCFDAIVTATESHLPFLLRNEDGELEIEANGGEAADVAQVSHQSQVIPVRPIEKGNLWFVGPLLNSHIPISDTPFAITSAAARVAANLDYCYYPDSQ